MYQGESNPFHKVAMELFQEYLMTGGFPEAVQAHIDGKTNFELDAIQQKILDVYKKEVALNKTLIDIPRGIETPNIPALEIRKHITAVTISSAGNITVFFFCVP